MQREDIVNMELISYKVKEEDVLVSNQQSVDQHVSEIDSSIDRVAVLGYGNFGKALSIRMKSAGIPVVIGTTHERPGNINFTSYLEAVKQAAIIVLAMPARAYESHLPSLTEALVGKVVIDVSNAEKETEPCNAERLANILPRSRVVKAFNTISAWSMENDTYGASRTTYVCGEDLNARQMVMQLSRDIGLTPIERGRLQAANELEKKALALFPEWRAAFWITLAMLLFQIVYLHGRYLAFKDSPSKLIEYIFMKYPNRIMGWMTLWLLAVVFLPGCIAGLLQLYRGTKYSIFPKVLDTWMRSRKQLGLFALLFACMHMCLSCIALAGEYYSSMSQVTKIQGTKQKLYQKYRWNAELSLLFATLSTALIVILGITSLPTVNQSMSWREWDFVQSKLGYLSMIFGFLHILFYVYKSFKFPYSLIIKHLPHHIFLQLLLPFIVMVLKLILILPGVRGKLQRIRAGWEGSRRSRDYTVY